MTGGSQQLRQFRRAVRDGSSLEAAAEQAGISLGEARLTVAEDLKSPPSAEAFEPIAPTTKDDTMTRTARKPKDDDTGLIKPKDFAQAKRLYLNDIKPAGSRQGEAMKDATDGYKAIKKGCNIQSTAARSAFRLVEMEDAKRDDWLRGFVGLLAEFNIPLQSNDLVDQAEKAPPAKPRLVTVPAGDHPADDSDLAGGDGDPPAGGDGFEATPAELAKQEGRGKAKPGTGAAAIAAMKGAAGA